jgi:hypothetical protein
MTRWLTLALMTLSSIGGSTAEKTLEEEAVTFSGQRVVLYKDGTWAPKNQGKPQAILFRGVKWGASVEEVKLVVKAEPVNTGANLLVYSDSIGGLNVQCVFLFAKNQFVRGKYCFTVEHADKNAFLTDFEAADALLKDKYGAPEKHEVQWRNDLYKRDPQNWGMAVATGRLSLCSTWKIGEVQVIHVLTGDNYRIEHEIEYSHDAMYLIENALQQEADRDKL